MRTPIIGYVLLDERQRKTGKGVEVHYHPPKDNNKYRPHMGKKQLRKASGK
jgi:hypothetical protein